MKKFLAISILVASAFIMAPQSRAYSVELKEFAEILNQGAAEEGCSVIYDGKNLVMTFPDSYFTQDDKDLISGIDDMQVFIPIFKSQLAESMGAETMTIFSAILSEFDANMVIKLNLNTGVKEIIMTPSDFN